MPSSLNENSHARVIQAAISPPVPRLCLSFQALNATVVKHAVQQYVFPAAAYCKRSNAHHYKLRIDGDNPRYRLAHAGALNTGLRQRRHASFFRYVFHVPSRSPPERCSRQPARDCPIPRNMISCPLRDVIDMILFSFTRKITRNDQEDLIKNSSAAHCADIRHRRWQLLQSPAHSAEACGVKPMLAIVPLS